LEGVKIGSGVRIVGVLGEIFLTFLRFLMVFYPFFRVFDQQLTGFCCRKCYVLACLIDF